MGPHGRLDGSSWNPYGAAATSTICCQPSTPKPLDLIVGGFALAAYGRPRYTKDLDVWVDSVDDNPERVFRALTTFGAALDGVTADDFRDPDCIFQIGVEPLRIDILNDISGVTFADAWPKRHASTYGQTPVFVISLEDLVSNKRASGRPRDLRDIATLEEEL